MEKTDKSAEEILDKSLFDHYKAMHEFAAQQLSEYKEVIKELLPLAEDGYKLAVKNGSHQEFLLDDRELIDRAKKLIEK